MEAINIHEHARMIDPIWVDEYFELFDQLEFENSMETLDELFDDDYVIPLDNL